MEDKLIFVVIPDVIRLLSTKYARYSSRRYSQLMDSLQKDPFFKLALNKVFEGATGKDALEAQLAARGVSGFCEALSEFYLKKKLFGHFGAVGELDLVEDVLYLEKRFEPFSLAGERRLFLLGMYLKLKDIENEKEGGVAQFLEISPFVDELLLKAKSKFAKIDWVILTLNYLLDHMDFSLVESALEKSMDDFELLLLGLEDKHRWGVFTALSLYGQAISDADFFLYRKV